MWLEIDNKTGCTWASEVSNNAEGKMAALEE